MTAFEFDDKNDPVMRANLEKLGIGGNHSIDLRVQVLQQRVAELLTALQKTGIKTEL